MLRTEKIGFRRRYRNAKVSHTAIITERDMSPEGYDAAIAAFIRTKGITRCPTACAAPTRASGNAADRAALRQRAERLEAIRQEKARRAWLRAVSPA